MQFLFFIAKICVTKRTDNVNVGSATLCLIDQIINESKAGRKCCSEAPVKSSTVLRSRSGFVWKHELTAKDKRNVSSILFLLFRSRLIGDSILVSSVSI